METVINKKPGPIGLFMSGFVRGREVGSVAWQARIDLQRPGIDTADKVTHAGEAAILEHPGSLGAANADMAVDDSVASGVEVAKAVGEFVERHQEASGQGAQGVFIGPADIDQADIVASFDFGFEIADTHGPVVPPVIRQPLKHHIGRPLFGLLPASTLSGGCFCGNTANFRRVPSATGKLRKALTGGRAGGFIRELMRGLT